MLVNIVLWIGGIVLLTLATWRVRAPFGRMSELDRFAENAKRYDSWRGTAASKDSETTGADVMRQVLRRQVLIWSAVGISGVVLIVAGFAIR